MGIRQKIILGFFSLGMLLFFSGMMSYLELSKLSTSTQSVLDTSFKNLELSKTMLDAVQDQNTALMQMMVSGNLESDSMLFVGRQKFDKAIREAQVSIRDLKDLDSIYAASLRYNEVVNLHFGEEPSRDNLSWFVEIYKTSYYKLTSSIKDFMISSQSTMGIKAKQLENNAYRAIMPGIIALAIGIIIIVIFFYFMDIYYIRPVLKITTGLRNYLQSHIPFKINIEGRDEVSKLKEHIETLIDQLKSKKSE